MLWIRIHDFLFEKNVQECVKHAFYKGDWTRSPYDSDTEPDYNPGGEKGKYSWVKAPSFRDEPAQVGPVAHVLAMYAARYEPAVQQHLTRSDPVVFPPHPFS